MLFKHIEFVKVSSKEALAAFISEMGILQNKIIPIAQPLIGEEEASAVYQTIKSGWISMGKKVEEFENMCCEYLNVNHSIAMNNGTSTLSSLLSALNIEKNDEVVIPNLTYISSANVVEYHSARPILADNEPKTFNVSANNIERFHCNVFAKSRRAGGAKTILS